MWIRIEEPTKTVFCLEIEQKLTEYNTEIYSLFVVYSDFECINIFVAKTETKTHKVQSLEKKGNQ